MSDTPPAQESPKPAGTRTPVEDTGSVGRKIVKAMLVIVFFWLFLKFGGFILHLLIAKLFPGTREADVCLYLYLYIFYMLVFSTGLKVILPAFIPVFMEEMETKGETEAWRLTNSILNLVIIGTVILLAAGLVFAPALASLAEGFDAEAQALATGMLRWMLPGMFGLVLGILTYALLNSYKVFNYPAAGEAAQKLVMVVVLFVAFRFLGVWAFALGFVIGCMAQLGINLAGLRRKLPLYRPSIPMPSFRRLGRETLTLIILAGVLVLFWFRIRALDLAKLYLFTGTAFLGTAYLLWLWWQARRSATAMGKFMALAAPLIIGVLFARYRDFATVYFQSFTQTGVFSDLEFAKKVGSLPTILVAYALSIAILPYLCDLVTKKQWDTFGDLLTRTIRLLALVYVPLTVVMILLDEPLIQLVLDRGNFPLVHLRYAAVGLSLFVSGLFFYALEAVIMQSFFSMQSVWWPTNLGIFSAILQTALMVVPIKLLGYDYPYEIFLVVALAYPISRIFKNGLLLAIMRRRAAVLPLGEALVFLAKLAVVCVGVGVVVYLSYGPVARAFPVNHLKEQELLFDTFNPEPKGWFSLDADELTVAGEPGGRALQVSYRRSGRRTVDVRLDLPTFRLDGAERLRLRLKADRPGGWELQLQDQAGQVYRRGLRLNRANEWHALDLVLAELKNAAGQPLDPSQWQTFLLADKTPVTGPALHPTTLWLDDLALATAEGREVLLDDFEPASSWTRSDGQAVEVADCQPGAEKPEFALRWDGTGELERDLRGRRLDRAQTLACKIKANAPAILTVELEEEGGSRHTVTKSIEASADRKTYEWALTDFGALALERLRTLRFRCQPAGAGGRRPEAGGPPINPPSAIRAEPELWLDNVAFRSHTPSLKFELLKSIRVGIPFTLGTLTFFLLLFAVRLEEASQMRHWLRGGGWATIKRKLRRKKAT